jgi:hypothetical protein
VHDDEAVSVGKQFPYRISEWYLLRHELAREERKKKTAGSTARGGYTFGLDF